MTPPQPDQAPPPSPVSISFPAPDLAPTIARPLSLRAAVLVWIAASLAGWALILASAYYLLAG